MNQPNANQIDTIVGAFALAALAFLGSRFIEVVEEPLRSPQRTASGQNLPQNPKRTIEQEFYKLMREEFSSELSSDTPPTFDTGYTARDRRFLTTLRIAKNR